MNMRPPSDPLKLGSMTIAAVQEIGNATAIEIETMAADVEKGAKEIGDNLRLLAEAVRGHCKVAGEHVTEYCAKSTSVLITIRDLQAKLGDVMDGHPSATPLPALDVPDFLSQAATDDPG